MRFDGRRAIGVGISTVSGRQRRHDGRGGPRDRLDELLSETPIGIEIGEVYFQGNMVTGAVNGFVVSLLQAIAIVIGVLLFAMGVRSGLLIGAILLHHRARDVHRDEASTTSRSSASRWAPS